MHTTYYVLIWIIMKRLNKKKSKNCIHILQKLPMFLHNEFSWLKNMKNPSVKPLNVWD